MIEINKAKLSKAIEKARQKRNTVRMVAFGQYEVITQELNRYEVRFQRSGLGRKLASCTCKAGQNGHACYHIASALPLHSAVASVRQQASEVRFNRTEPESKGRIGGIEI